MAKRKTKKKAFVKDVLKKHPKKPAKTAGYAAPLDAKSMFFGAVPKGSALFYDKNSIDTLKAASPLAAMSTPKNLPEAGLSDPGWVNYNVKFTSTLRPNAPHVFTQADVFKALEAFGNDVIDLIDASISNDRQRKAFKKFISASYERGIIHAKQLGRKDGITLFRYEDITPALKNTEDSNANLHTS